MPAGFADDAVASGNERHVTPSFRAGNERARRDAQGQSSACAWPRVTPGFSRDDLDRSRTLDSRPVAAPVLFNQLQRSSKAGLGARKAEPRWRDRLMTV